MACVNARATDSRRVAPACCMCAPDTLMGLKRGTSRAQNSITSAVSRIAASTGKGQVHGEDRGRGGIDGEVGTDCIKGNAVKQELHVGQRVNSHAGPPHLLAH